MQSAIATIICWGSYPLGEFLFTGWDFIHWVGFYPLGGFLSSTGGQRPLLSFNTGNFSAALSFSTPAIVTSEIVQQILIET